MIEKQNCVELSIIDEHKVNVVYSLQEDAMVVAVGHYFQFYTFGAEFREGSHYPMLYNNGFKNLIVDNDGKIVKYGDGPFLSMKSVDPIISVPCKLSLFKVSNVDAYYLKFDNPNFDESFLIEYQR
jgi:hypothetical protein